MFSRFPVLCVHELKHKVEARFLSFLVSVQYRSMSEAVKRDSRSASYALRCQHSLSQSTSRGSKIQRKWKATWRITDYRLTTFIAFLIEIPSLGLYLTEIRLSKIRRKCILFGRYLIWEVLP